MPLRALHLALAIVVALLCVTLAQALPAFPGAEGWGSETVGGRGGAILFVTTLEDTGSEGALRWALTRAYPRIVLFRVSGNIELTGDLYVGGWSGYPGGEDYSYLTVDGSSAPGGGVCISGRGIHINDGVHDVIFRNLRFRQAHNGSALAITSGSHHVMIDHCSFSWGDDQQVSAGHGQPVAMEEGFTTDITFSHCIIAEALMYWGEGQATLFAHGVDRLSIHHDLIMSNPTRNPKLDGDDGSGYWVRHPVYDLRNNVIYNWGGDATSLNHGAHGNIVSSVYKQGPGVVGPPDGMIITDPYPADYGTRLYVEDNVAPTWTDADPITQWHLVYISDASLNNITRWGAHPDVYQATSPFPAPPVTTVPSCKAENLVLCTAGAFPRDATDATFVQQYWDGEGDCGAVAAGRDGFEELPELAFGAPPTDTDDDGMPDAWENSVGLNPNSAGDAWLDRDSDGYPNLEEYLHAAFVVRMPPAPVTCLSAEDTPNDDGGSITLDWSGYDEPGDLANTFIYRATESFSDITGMTPLGYTASGLRSYVDDTAEDGVEYWYAVAPVDTSAQYNATVLPAGPATSGPNEHVDAPPTCTITNPTEGATVEGNPILFAGTASDDGSVTRVVIRLNGNSWMKANGTTTWSRALYPRLGANLVEARALDDAGHWGPIVGVNFTRLQAQPTCKITSPANGATVAGNPIVIRGTAADNGSVERVIVRFNGGIWLKATGTTNWSRSIRLPLGPSLIEARARDNEGNWGRIVSITVNRIQDQPTCRITSPANGATVVGNPVLITGTATDNTSISRVVVRFNGGIWLNATGTTAWTRTLNLPPGSNLIEARAQDSDGNWGPTAAIVVNKTAG